MEKIIDIEERIPSLRERKQRRANRKFIFVITIFILALLILLYFQSPLSRINKVEVQGASLLELNNFMEEMSIKEGEPLWGFKIKEVERSFQEIDTVKEVTVQRKWLRDVKVTLTEWHPVAYIEKDGKRDLLLENGYIFGESVTQDTESVPTLKGFTDAKQRKRMLSQLLKIDDEVYQRISEVIYKGKGQELDRVTVYTDDGYEIRAMISTFAEKMAYYPEITTQLKGHEKGVIDMEVGTYFTPFSKLYGQVEEKEEEVNVENE